MRQQLMAKSGVNRGIQKKKEMAFFFYIFLFLILWLVASKVELLDALDLHRYYEGAEMRKNLSTAQVIDYAHDRSVDFIYYIILHWALNLSIPLNAVTALIVTLFYAVVLKTMKLLYNGKIEWWVTAVAVLTCPLTLVVEISRNLTAFMFLYIAFYFYYKQKRLWSILYVLLSVFTHFSVIMYVLVILLALLIQKWKIKPKVILILLSAFLLSSYLLPSYLIDLISTVAIDQDMHVNQLTRDGVRGIDAWDTVRYGIKVPAIFSILYSVILLLSNKRQGFEFWLLFLLLVMLSFFINSSQMFSDRTQMFLPMFWALNIACIFKEGTNKDKTIVHILSLIGILPILLHFWSQRPTYLFFLY